jgi:DNA-directed RNA polymerase subunit H (RpoH/RPB5)
MAYTRYINLRKLLGDYRGLQIVSPEIKENDFIVLLHRTKAIIIECVYPDNFRKPELRGKKMFGVFCDENVPFANISSHMDDLLKKISVSSKDPCHALIAIQLETFGNIKSQVIEKINKQDYKHISVQIIPHHRLTIELPKHALCAKHSIMTEDDIRSCQVLFIKLKEIQRIYTSDPMIIWIGGFADEYVKIDRLDPENGQLCSYRIVKQGNLYGSHRQMNPKSKSSTDD